MSRKPALSFHCPGRQDLSPRGALTEPASRGRQVMSVREKKQSKDTKCKHLWVPPHSIPEKANATAEDPAAQASRPRGGNACPVSPPPSCTRLWSGPPQSL